LIHENDSDIQQIYWQSVRVNLVHVNMKKCILSRFTRFFSFAQGPYSSALGAGAFFGFLAMFLYGYDAFVKFRGWRAGQLAQGERKVTQQTSATTTSNP
jgi:hypothetical protein